MSTNKTSLTVCPVVTATMDYEPWTDGHAVGFKVTRATDGKVGYVYLNPSVDENGGPDDTPAVFLYMGGHGNPAEDGAQHFYSIDDTVFDTTVFP